MKPCSPRIIVAIMLALCLCVGCASTPTDNGDMIQMNEETQKALARILSRNAARVVCTMKLELAPEINMITAILAGEGATVEALGEWTKLLASNVGLDEDIHDLLIILEAQGVGNLAMEGEGAQFTVTASEVFEWVRMCAKAAHTGCSSVSLP